MSNGTHGAFYTETLAQSDGNTFQRCRGILVIVGGAVRVGFPGGKEDTYSNLQPGWHPLRINQLYDTGTAASAEIHAAY